MSKSALEIAPRRLNPTDATLWDIERDPNLRTTIVAVLLLDRPVPPERLRNDLEAASRVIPRLRQRVVPLPAGVGTPSWELDPTFDITQHVSFVDAPANVALIDVVADLAETMASADFDRSRPLWECTHVGGRKTRAALIMKVHHSLTDGVGGVELLDVLLDESRGAPPRDLEELPAPRPATKTSTTIDDLGHSATRAVKVPVDVSTRAAASAVHPVRSLNALWAGARSTARLLAPTSGPLSPLMTDRGPERQVGMRELDLSRLHDAAARQGCTINDAFFAGVLGGVSAYHRESESPAAQLRVLMPINYRSADSPTGGNHWTPVRFTVPADIEDPLDRMVAMRALVLSSRREPTLSFSQSLASAVQLLPSALSSGLVSGMMQGVDLVLTNVPGLAEHRYLGGARVERLFAFAPTGGAALNVALYSHVDTACVGTLSDAAAIASPDRMAELIAEGLEEVVAAAETAPAAPTEATPSSAVPPPGDTGPQRLSAVDAGFLAVETPNTPMHIGGVFVLAADGLRDHAGRIRLEDARRHIEARLRLVPRFRRKLSEVPLGLGRPLWVNDIDFDIAHHIKQTAVVAPGGQQELLDLCADLHEEPLDRSRPLWELWLVDGLADGRVGIVEKVHHALIDGVSGVELAAAMFDLEPDVGPEVAIPVPRSSGPGPLRRATDAVVEQVIDPIALARRTISAVRSSPAQLMDQAHSVAAVAREVMQPAAMTPTARFNRPVGTQRALQAVVLDLDRVDAVRQLVDATVNDVVLACIAGALRRWLIDEGEDLFDVHVLVPVSTRRGDMNVEVGNRVGIMLLVLPVAEPDPLRRLRLVEQRMRRLKAANEGEGAAILLEGLDYLPAIGFGSLARLVALQPIANLVVTNVPGPREPLYFLGAEVEEMIPVVPLAPGLGLGVAVLSYRNQLTISLFADPDACPDLVDLAAAVLDELGHLDTAVSDA